MIIVTGAVRFGSGEIERLRSVLVNNIETTRQEAGCLAYSYSVDLIDPNLLRVSELWEDEASVDAHTKKLPEMMAPLQDARIEAMSITAYEGEFLRNIVGE